MSEEKLHLSSPGEILLEEFIKPLNLTLKEVANDLIISEIKLNELINGKQRINPEYARKLSMFFGMDEITWLNLQRNYYKALFLQKKQERRQL